MGYFFDAATGGPLALELRSIDGRKFTMLRRIGYQSNQFGEPFIVPADLATFETDLASVPDVFLWLVPRSGVYAPAAALHDALTSTPEAQLGPQVPRATADVIFREAMQDLGTGKVRTWMMWSAVTIDTMWQTRRLAARLAIVVTFAVIVGLGTLSTLDLFDVVNVLPWMGHRVWWQELIGGFLAAVIIPPLLAPTWGRFWRAEVITTWALAFLLHVTVALAIIYGIYLALERLVSGPQNQRGVRPDLRKPTGA